MHASRAGLHFVILLEFAGLMGDYEVGGWHTPLSCCTYLVKKAPIDIHDGDRGLPEQVEHSTCTRHRHVYCVYMYITMFTPSSWQGHRNSLFPDQAAHVHCNCNKKIPHSMRCLCNSLGRGQIDCLLHVVAC